MYQKYKAGAGGALASAAGASATGSSSEVVGALHEARNELNAQQSKS
ncbi:hypothetical protein EM6_0766 [Asticcacaulis excentricus]|uniref:Uncharacterized protein n=1 Tax=Asticcacaulis excentricus TaxID=78587 RepID=A0A3G9G7C6_9CAUL|nr:hypothetical protein EM6_0766 [Asticcacaulis excentricus]